MKKYFKKYKWSNIAAMLHNQKLDPEICTDNFKNRLVVITGTTSGIGKDAAKKFASKGADILSINRNEEKSKDLCQLLESKYGVVCSYMIADFSKLADTHKVAKQLVVLDRDINVLIHNAGVHLSKKLLQKTSLNRSFKQTI